MGQVLHGSATTTEAVRRAIQHSHESLRQLSTRYGLNPKTVAKWKKRVSTADRRTGPTAPRSTVLSREDEAIILAFRRHTLLPLDDCLYALQATLPQLTRSSLHRCLQRRGVSRLPEVEGDKPLRRTFKSYPIGYFPIDIAEVQTAEGKLYLYVAIDRTSKFAFVQVVRKTGRTSASAFLVALVKAVPYRIHTVLTDNGIKLIVASRLQNDNNGILKRTKDVSQAQTLMGALIRTRRQFELAEVYAEAWRRGPSWRDALTRGLSYLPDQRRTDITSGLAIGLAELGEEAADFGL